MDDGYRNADGDPRGAWRDDNLLAKTYSFVGDYPVELPSGRVVSPPKGLRWRVSEAQFRELVADGRIWFGPSGNNVPRLKRFLSEVRPGAACKTVWRKDEVGDTGEGTRDLKKLFDGDVVFTSPKPVRLIKRIIDLATKPDSLSSTSSPEAARRARPSWSTTPLILGRAASCSSRAMRTASAATSPTSAAEGPSSARGSPRASATCAWRTARALRRF